MERFVPCAVGKRTFRARVKCNDANELCTISDEALMLILLENNDERYKDIYRKQGGKRVNKERGRHKESEVPTKYTSGGIAFSQTTKNSKGWSREGIEHFNELRLHVKNDREQYPHFLQGWLTEFRAQYLPKSQKRGRKDVEPIIEADDDFDDHVVSNMASV